MDLNALIPGIESFVMEDVEITNNVTTGENEETAATAETPAETPAEAPAEETTAESSEGEQPAEMKSSYFNW